MTETNNQTARNKIVSLENFDDINDNYILRSPNRGRIYRGPNWNAFNRETLGSIPRKSENILFQEKNSESKKGLMSQSERFTHYQKIESVKFSYPGPGNYKMGNSLDTTSVSTNPSFSSKGYGNGFVSKYDRFDDPKAYYEKFYPGPGQYKNTKSSVSPDKMNFRYKSLYSSNDTKSLKISKDNPGPGNYNPIAPHLLRRQIVDKPNFFFNSKEVRLKGFFGKQENDIPGPGKYFRHYYDFIKDADKTSHFFKHSNKPEDLLEKHLNFPRVQKFKVPGPGEYNLRRDLVDESKANKNKKPFIDEQEKLQEKMKEEDWEDDNNMSKVENIEEIRSNLFSYKNGVKSVFESKSPKQKYLKINHVPGPSYYNPQLMPNKNSFNCNIEKQWI